MMSYSEELSVFRALKEQSARLLSTQDDLMMGPYQQLHSRICAVLGMMLSTEDEVNQTQEYDT